MGGVGFGGAIHSDCCFVDDDVAEVQVFLHGACGAYADECFDAEAGEFFYGEGNAGAAHAGGHDEDRLSIHFGGPGGEVSVAGDKGGVRIKGFGKAFDASRVAGNEGVFGAFYHFFGQAGVVHDFAIFGIIRHNDSFFHGNKLSFEMKKRMQ